MRQLSIPQIDLSKGLGTNFLGEPQLYQSVINPLNIFLLILTPIQFIIFRTLIFLVILQIGTFYYIKEFVNTKNLPITGSLLIATLPLFYSSFLGSPYFDLLCAIPLLLFVLERSIKEDRIIYKLGFGILILLIGPDALGFLIILELLLAYFFCRGFVERKGFKAISWISIKFGLITFCVCASYLMPFVSNLLENRAFEQKYGVEDVSEIGFKSYWLRILNVGAKSILIPVEGSAIYLYVPFFVLIVIMWRTFGVKGNQKRILLSLLVTASVIAILPSFLYLFAMTSSYVPSYIRHHFNLIPILLFIAFIVAIDNLESHKIKIFLGLIAIASCFEAILLGFGEMPLIDPKLTSLLNLPIPFNHEYPWANLIFANFILAFVFILPNLLQRKNSGLSNSYLVAVALAVSFFSLSVHTELQRYGLVVTSSSYRVDNFSAAFESFNFGNRLVNNNYRVLLTGLENRDRGDSMNIKSLPALELNNTFGFNTLFQYREVEHPYLNVVYNSFECLGCDSKSNPRYGYFPPKTSDVVRKKELLSFLSIRYVVSLDERIQDRDFKLLDSYKYEDSPRGVENSEDGTLFLYEFNQGRSIARIHGNCKAETKGYSLSSMFEAPIRLENLILEYPFGETICNSIPGSDSRDLHISNVSGNTIKIRKFQTEDPVLVDFSIINRKGWRAFDNGVEIPIIDSYDGLIAMQIGPGDHLIELRYQDKSLLFGLLLVCMLFSVLIFMSIKSRKTYLQVSR
jgi:hypothetical protein